MSWNTLSAAQVAAQLTAAEKAAVDTASGASPLAGITSNSVAEVRGYIRAGGYTLGTGDTVPDALRHAAIIVSIWRFLITLPNAEKLQTKQRETEYERAVKLLERVADGEFDLEEPAAADDEDVVTASPRMTDKTRELTRDEQDGT